MSTLLPDAESSALRLPTEGTLYLEEDPPTSDDENPCVGKEVDRLLSSVTKQQKGQRTVKQDQPMLYVYLGSGSGQVDDREKPLKLKDMIKRQVDQHESKVDEGSTSHLCDRTASTNEAKVSGGQQEERSNRDPMHDNWFKVNGDEKGYDLTADSGSSKTEANAEDRQAS
ncbi:hypothetical protein LTR17_014713 [Elasticomyces elasticus]|nr:hypothetical protein LTR17_014713 [Elasticomyces elasticus]